MSILRSSTPNSSHETVVLVAVDYPITHRYSAIRWLVTDYGDFCQLNLLKNSEIHWFQFIMKKILITLGWITGARVHYLKIRMSITPDTHNILWILDYL